MHPDTLHVDVATDAGKPRLFVLLLLDRFTMISFTGALECLRIANRLSRRTLYEWRIVSVEEGPIVSSAGIALPSETALPELPRDATIVICGGVDVARAATPKLIAWLRREARRGAAIGGLCTASYVLAKAGLLDGRRATIHWENRDGFAEDFFESDAGGLRHRREPFHRRRGNVVDRPDAEDRRRRFRRGTRQLSGRPADLQLDPHRSGCQRLSTPTRIGVRHPKLAQVVQMMERNIEEPISTATSPVTWT